MYECFHCLARAVIWDSDFDFSDVGLEGEGIVHFCHCANCGAQIEYYISIDAEEEEVEDLQSEYLRQQVEDEDSPKAIRSDV